LVCCEGLAGGAAYVNVFYRLGKGDGVQEEEGDEEGGGLRVKDRRRKDQEKEFVCFSPLFSLSLSCTMNQLTVNC